MTFVKGQSGNPAGRQPGSRNKVMAAIEEMVDGDAEEVARKLIDHAGRGNPTAMRICFGRLWPKAAGRPVSIILPPVKTAADLDKWPFAILDGIAEGEVTPVEAGQLMKVVEIVGRRLKAAETDARVAKLERTVAALTAKIAAMSEAALASATNLQAEQQGEGPPISATRHRVEPEPIEDAALASAGERQVDFEPIVDPAPASASDLQAQPPQDRPAVPPAEHRVDLEAAEGVPLASATNLQGPAANRHFDRPEAVGRINVAREMLAALIERAGGIPQSMSGSLPGLTRQSIRFEPAPFGAMDARVRPAHDGGASRADRNSL